MGYFELCLLAMAMAMDCFTVSVTCGIYNGVWDGRLGPWHFLSVCFRL